MPEAYLPTCSEVRAPTAIIALALAWLTCRKLRYVWGLCVFCQPSLFRFVGKKKGGGIQRSFYLPGFVF